MIKIGGAFLGPTVDSVLWDDKLFSVSAVLSQAYMRCQEQCKSDKSVYSLRKQVHCARTNREWSGGHHGASSLTPSLGLIIFPGDERPLSRTVQKWCTLSQRNVSVRKDKTRLSVPFTPAFMGRKVVFLSFLISSKLFVDILYHRTCIRQSACRERNGRIAFRYLLRECAM